MKTICIVAHFSDDGNNRETNFYPCESKEVALKLLKRIKNNALTEMSEWTDGQFNVESDKEDYFCIATNDWLLLQEIAIEEKEILTITDVTPPKVTKYGREWFETYEDYAFVENNPNWWFTAEFTEGKLYINNLLGIMLLIEPDGRRFITSNPQ